MTWKTSMIEHHMADIERMKTSIEWLESGKMDVGEVDAAGWKTSLKDESIATYKRIISDLEGVVANLEKRDEKLM